MGPPIQPQQPWQLEKKPHEWQQVLLQARQILHDPNQAELHQEAVEAIEDANQALSVYDESEVQNWSDAPRMGVEGSVGVAESGLNALSGLLHLPGNLIKGAVNVVRDPEGSAEALDKGIVNTMDRLGSVLSHPIRTLEEATPREVGNAVGTAGTLAVPFARAGSAGSFSRVAPLAKDVQGPVDAATEAFTTHNPNTVGGNVARGLGRIARGVVRAPSAAMDIAGSWANKAKYSNIQQQEQAALAAARRAGVEAINTQVIPQRIQQGATRQSILDETLGRQSTLGEQQAARLRLLEEEIGRSGPTNENLDLRNENLNLRNEKLRSNTGSQGGRAGPASQIDESGLFANQPSPSKPGFSSPRPYTPSPADKALADQFGVTGNPGTSVEGPPIRPLTKADEAFSRLRTGVEPDPLPTAHAGVEQPLDPTAQPFNEMMNISQKNKWPSLANQDIESYLRQIAAGNWPPRGKP